MAKGHAAPFPSREQVLEFLEKNPDRASKRDIARAFGIKGSGRVLLKDLLKELVVEGRLDRRRGRRLADPRRLPAVAVIEVIDLDVDGELWGRPASWSEDAEPPKILLAPLPRHRAPALGIGDRALARLERRDDGSYLARVMRVLGAGPDRVIGEYALVAGQGRIRSSDRRKQDLAVSGADSAGAQPGELVFAEVRAASRAGLRQGRVIERLGRSDDPRSLSLIAIHDHDLPTEFGPSALAEAADARVPSLGDGVDLRPLPLVTIDPDEARDHDDAVWAGHDDDPANPGGWQVVIAIADVARYVLPGSALDREALRRGNSAYFPDRVVPMLPEALSNGVCSLRPKEDRACMAVRVWLDARGRKRRHGFVRGLMRSAARLTYAQVQTAIDGRPDDAAGPLLESVIRPLYDAHAALTQARAERDPLELEVPERRVRIGPQGEVLGIEPRPFYASNRLIEDYMILANVCAAETIEHARLPCMYRVHAEPSREKLESLRDFLETLDLRLARGQVLTPAMFNRILRRAKDQPHQRLVNEVVLRSQAQAEYSPENLGHFGLALPRYAHFTSPIRRYADVLVHRAVISACGLGSDGLGRDEAKRFRAIGETISATERRAMAAERDAVDRFTAHYLAQKMGGKFRGHVSGVTRFGLFVTLEDTGADGLVPVRDLGDEYFRHDDKRHALVGERTGAAWRLGDRVEVALREVDPLSGRLRFELLSEPAIIAKARRRRR
ncbi:MAG: ribonuclease R [Alphaproteobacteria bacterium]|nr:ribonuclease R [Alphaproteobacteria bacterium]